MTAVFADRLDAGDRLADALLEYRGPGTVVLGLPRGGVPVASRVARSLDAPLDVLVVRKLGAPAHPEFAVGAIGEGGVRLVDAEALRLTRVGEEQLARVERDERLELDRRSRLYRAGGAAAVVRGHRVIIVDDGVATGATAAVACRIARLLGATEVVLAVPVAPHDWAQTLAGEADRFVAVITPRDFWAVGQWYERFDQTSDDEVVALLAGRKPHKYPEEI